ncbi:endonuclease-reverse transcriptase [Trichonephila clavipes]|uniref:Endonuclease-reverse transcriptase n=1 Tax=Trichonephila clavipes TaxID=2585209 RepID=A0A8X7BH06_TRICX|nr:endonuclease-reverse transcriptase [Trichonephila clavipes]
MVLKANDRRTSCPCHDEFRGPRSDYVRQALQRTSIRSNRLRWLGHIWRSPENNQTRAYTFKNPMGSRTRGRPPTRWIDDVENDLKTLNIKNWQRVAAYRWNWRKPRPVTEERKRVQKQIVLLVLKFILRYSACCPTAASERQQSRTNDAQESLTSIHCNTPARHDAKGIMLKMILLCVVNNFLVTPGQRLTVFSKRARYPVKKMGTKRDVE